MATKPFVALAGLELGVRVPSDTVLSTGEFFIPGQSRAYRDDVRGGFGRVDLVQAIAKSVNTYFFQLAVDMGIDHEVLTGIELSQRFPGYRLPQEIMALYQKDGGFLTPERCVVSYVNAALAHGAEIHGRETVLGWEPQVDFEEGIRKTIEYFRGRLS